MTNKTELIKIIDYLKTRPIANRKDIAKAIDESWHSGKFKAMLETLIDYKLIREIKTDTYKITPDGEKFESFEKLDEDKNWEIKLAKSNIEANKLQKENFEFLKRKERLNRKLMIITIIVGVATVISTITHIILLVLQD